MYYRRVQLDNVSLISSQEKSQKLIACWELVEQHLIRATGKQKHSYVETAKTTIYNNIKDRFPSVIRDNADFFNFRTSLFKLILR